MVFVIDTLQQGRLQQDLLNRKARLLKIAANQAIKSGGVAERNFRRDGGLVIGQQRAAFGAAGVALDTGSAVEVQETTQRVIELDALQIRNNAAREAWGLRTQMRFVKFEADLAWQQAKQNAFKDVIRLVAAYFTGGASLAVTGTGETPSTDTPDPAVQQQQNPNAFSNVSTFA